MRAVAIALDGVLRKTLDKEAQDRSGALLYASLAPAARLVVLGGDDYAADKQFLLINGYTAHTHLDRLLPEDGHTVDTRKHVQLKRLRSEGYRFELVVVSDPALARVLLREGFPVLLYAHPNYTPRLFEPNTVRSWAELRDEVDYQVHARALSQKDPII